MAHPARELKALQRWLVEKAIYDWPVHEAARAYRMAANIRDNAAVHAGKRFLLRIDFEDFFPSILKKDVQEFIGTKPGASGYWTEEDKTFFLGIVLKDGRLCIGAPTSPNLTNSICYLLDVELTRLATSSGAVYTRYADDLFFSTDIPNCLAGIERDIEKVIHGLPYPGSLRVNAAKTRHTSKKSRRVVTGVTLTCTGELSVGRQLKHRLRSLVFRFETLRESEREFLAGILAHVKSIEPEFINRLILKYGINRVKAAMRQPGQKDS